MPWYSLLSLAILLTIASIARGGGPMSMQPPNPTPPSATRNVSLSISDAPPSGVTILRFEIEVMSASLQPSSSGQQAVPMFSAPQEVELEHLQTEPAFLVNRDVPAGTYEGLSATFANPQMTIFNRTGSSLTVGSQTCAANQVCNITPTLNSMTVSVAQPTAPFPLAQRQVHCSVEGKQRAVRVTPAASPPDDYMTTVRCSPDCASAAKKPVPRHVITFVTLIG